MKAVCEESRCERHPLHHRSKGLVPVECFEPQCREVRPGLIGEVGQDGKVDCWCANRRVHDMTCHQCYPDVVRLSREAGGAVAKCASPS